MADAQQRGYEGVPPRLRQNTEPRIHQQHRDISGGGAGGHVARVLFVAGRVGDNEGTFFGGEETIRDIDGDALFALRLQPVHQQREIDIIAVGAVLAAVAFQGGHLIVEQLLAVIQQPPDQGGFAVIHAAAGQEPQ